MSTTEDLETKISRLVEMAQKSTRGIISQGGPSIEPNGRCRYRGPNGSRCAAGWLLPDEKYDLSIEGKRVAGLLWARENLDEDEIDLAECLQTAHDDAAHSVIRLGDHGYAPPFMGHWKKHLRAELRKFASSFSMDDWPEELVSSLRERLTAVVEEIPEEHT